ncbi:uncharacterized protein [Dendropsophus ebraccatus]|uniref:uncharacterized protein isoform X1 n=1 Tax=Dendropsophus ebraccatus TaxID=150705 RepID=UPI0038311D84
MDPEHPWNNNSEPVRSQPQWQNTSATHPDQIYNAKAVVPPMLTCLVEVEEVRLQKKAFYSRSGRTLFNIHRESECCGPSFNVRFQDPGRKDVVSLRADSGGCCGGDTCLKIIVPPALTIGFITFSNISHKTMISIQMTFGEPAFTAELPLSSSHNPIEILSVNGSCPVASITKDGEKESSEVIFKFPMDMKATLKVLILAAFLYMRYQLNELYRTRSFSSYDVDYSAWVTAGGAFIPGVDTDGGYCHHDGDCGGGDCGDEGDCGCGDWGDGGDCVCADCCDVGV